MSSSGQSLYNNKEVKDLFVNIVDKVVEPIKQYKFTSEDLHQVSKDNVQITNVLKTRYFAVSVRLQPSSLRRIC